MTCIASNDDDGLFESAREMLQLTEDGRPTRQTASRQASSSNLEEQVAETTCKAKVDQRIDERVEVHKEIAQVL